jgi:phosphoglycolate phosphatase-like HAD superfamily hydrolase
MDLVVFDVDGTLTATNEVDTRCFARAFIEEFGKPIETTWERYPHRTDSGIIRHNFVEHFGRTPTPAELERFRTRFMVLLEREWLAMPRAFAEVGGAGAALARLRREQRCAIAIATGGWQISARFKLARAGIMVTGIPAAFADDAEAREEIVQSAIARAREHYGCGFERIVLVGDSDCDVATAARLQIPFVGIAGTNDGVLRQAGAGQILRGYEDFDAFIEALSRGHHLKP